MDNLSTFGDSIFSRKNKPFKLFFHGHSKKKKKQHNEGHPWKLQFVMMVVGGSSLDLESMYKL